jgi:hypothetical protein
MTDEQIINEIIDNTVQVKSKYLPIIRNLIKSFHPRREMDKLTIGELRNAILKAHRKLFVHLKDKPNEGII